MNQTLFLGLTLALGIILVVTSLAQHREVDFADRIAPQLRAAELKRQDRSQAEVRGSSLYQALRSLAQPLLLNLADKLTKSSLDSQALEGRLEQAGQGMSLLEYRIQQILWALASFASSTILVSLAAVQGRVSFLAALLLILVSTFMGAAARDYWLTQQIKKRERDMLDEFPALAELMALSVTAGESALGSLERVVRSSQGELAREFTSILAMTRSGESLVTALQAFSQKTSVTALSRFVDGLIVAIERGTPLADVLRAQAQDVRDDAKRQLMETAGKKEIGMMVPVVFMILPLTVIFALFPGLSLLNLNF